MHTQAYNQEPRPSNHETPNARKVQEDGDKVKEKHGRKNNEGEGRNGRYPPPATPTHLAHALSIGDA